MSHAVRHVRQQCFAGKSKSCPAVPTPPDNTTVQWRCGMTRKGNLMRSLRQAAVVMTLFLLPLEVSPQDAKQKPAGKTAPEESPFAIELQETRVRFENDGTGRQEIHVRSRVETQKGAQQLSQLTFRYTRSIEELEINSVVVHKPGGGSIEVRPSAVVDRPVEEVRGAAAYEEAREKA